MRAGEYFLVQLRCVGELQGCDKAIWPSPQIGGSWMRKHSRVRRGRFKELQHEAS